MTEGIKVETAIVTAAVAKRAVRMIISGGQTGADQGALKAAADLGIATGGWMPKGWLTQGGPRPDLEKYGLKEHKSPKYPPRTYANVRDANATLIFGNQTSPGCQLTRSACMEYGRPVFWVAYPSAKAVGNVNLVQFRAWLVKQAEQDMVAADNKITLNVAGNREERNSGIEQAVYDFLVSALS